MVTLKFKDILSVSTELLLGSYFTIARLAAGNKAIIEYVFLLVSKM